MLVLRIENDDRKGIYTSGRFTDICTQTGIAKDIAGYDLRYRHPTPCDDSGMANAWRELTQKESFLYRFGFKSFAQFRNWFHLDEILACAAEFGFKLSVYIVPDKNVIVGWTQVAFIRAESELVFQFDPTETRENIETKLASLETLV